jgi:hypothetical protein
VLTVRLHDTGNTLGRSDFGWLMKKLRSKQWNTTGDRGIKFGEDDKWSSMRQRWQVTVANTSFFDREGYTSGDDGDGGGGDDAGGDDEEDEESGEEDEEDTRGKAKQHSKPKPKGSDAERRKKMKVIEQMVKTGLNPKTQQKLGDKQLDQARGILEKLRKALGEGPTKEEL